MQCYPNSSAMLIRSIIKQMNPRLERVSWLKSLLLQRTEGIGAQCKSSSKLPHCMRYVTGMTGRQSYIHNSNIFMSTNVFCCQKCVLWILSLLLGWTDTTWQLEFGVKQCYIWLNIKYRVDMYKFGFQMYVPWIENHRHSTARSQFPAHSWAPFCMFLLAKKQGNAKERAPAKQLRPKLVLLGRGAQSWPSVVCGSIWVRMQKKKDIF